MELFKSTKMKMLMLMLAILVVSAIAPASAANLYTIGAGDGMAGRDWYSGAYYWVDTLSPTVVSNHAGGDRWLYRGAAIIDISSVAGQTLAPHSVSFNFYSFGFSGTQLQHIDSDPGAEVTTGFANGGGTYIADLDETAGWKSYEVTSMIQADINNGYTHSGFIFPAVVNNGGGSFAASEDIEGRGAYLAVTTVPEPSSMIAFASGLISLLGIRRRKA